MPEMAHLKKHLWITILQLCIKILQFCKPNTCDLQAFRGKKTNSAPTVGFSRQNASDRRPRP